MPNLFDKPRAEGKLCFHYAEARKVACETRTASYLGSYSETKIAIIVVNLQKLNQK